MHRQIDRLFSRFPAASVTRNSFTNALKGVRCVPGDRSPNCGGSCQLIQIIDGRVLVAIDRKTGSQQRLGKLHHEGRMKDVVCMLRMATAREHIDDVELLVCVSDYGELALKHELGSTLPVLTANFDGSQGSGIPIPMPSRGPLSTICPETNRTAPVSRSLSPPPWEQKRPIAFFRGNWDASRPGSGRDCRNLQHGWEQTPCVRSRLTAELRGVRGFDVRLNQYTPEAEWEDNKYLLIIGNSRGWADRLGASLLKSSASILVDGGRGEWFYPLLDEGTHYLRANASASSVMRVVQWAEAHDETVRAIPQAAARLAHELFATDSLVHWVVLVATAVRRTLSFAPQRREGWGEPRPGPAAAGVNCSKIRDYHSRKWCLANGGIPLAG